jgi:hypothetical protein
MGLKLRYNLFYAVQAEPVYQALASFWGQRHCQLQTTAIRALPAAAWDTYTLYEERGGWTLLDWDGGWEWTLRREAQLHVSRVLACAGLLVFVYDGDYWGYELFNQGHAVDHFVQAPDASGWFPGHSCSGQPHVFAAQFPSAGLQPEDIAAYLAPLPEDWDDELVWDRPARPGDEFSRGDECAVIDFLRMLGVGIELRDYGTSGRYVTPVANPLRSFKVISPAYP